MADEKKRYEELIGELEKNVFDLSPMIKKKYHDEAVAIFRKLGANVAEIWLEFVNMDAD